jgi:hypothetical protein
MMVAQAVSALYLWRKVAAGAAEGTLELVLPTMQAEMEDQVGVEAPAKPQARILMVSGLL